MLQFSTVSLKYLRLVTLMRSGPLKFQFQSGPKLLSFSQNEQKLIKLHMCNFNHHFEVEHFEENHMVLFITENGTMQLT